MDINEKIVREEFDSLCDSFHLKMERIDNNEFVLIGANFFILIWLDRDGVSLRYVRSMSEKLQEIDLVRYVALRRGWDAYCSEKEGGDKERLRSECFICVRNMQKYAGDILRGNPDFLSDKSISFSVLSDASIEAIKEAVRRK